MKITETAFKMGLRGGRYELDGYNQQVLTDGVSYTITTRTFGDNNHFLLEIDEGCDKDTPGHEGRIH